MAWLWLLAFCVCLPATFHPCFFMMSTPSFKTDFLPFPWYKYMSRNNGHQEREVENYRCDLQKLQMRVLRPQPDLETPLKEPPSSQQSPCTQVWLPFEEGWGLGQELRLSGNIWSSTATPKVLEPFLLKAACGSNEDSNLHLSLLHPR